MLYNCNGTNRVRDDVLNCFFLCLTESHDFISCSSITPSRFYYVVCLCTYTMVKSFSKNNEIYIVVHINTCFDLLKCWKSEDD